MMSALIIPDQTNVLAAAGLVAPKVADMVPGVPTAGLVDVWRRASGMTRVSGKVSSWQGFNGAMLRQVDSAKQPTGAPADGVSFSATGDYLAATLAPTAEGYLVARVVKQALGVNAAIVGSHQDLSDPAQRLSLGFSDDNRAAAAIGSKSFNATRAGTPVALGDMVVIGVAWSGGTYSLRLNGNQVSTGTYNDQTGGVAAGVGSRAYWVGGANVGTQNMQLESPDRLIGLAIYSTAQTAAALTAIDAAMALV